MTKYYYQDKEVDPYSLVNIKKYWSYSTDLSKAYLVDIDNLQHFYVAKAKSPNIILSKTDFFFPLKDYEKSYKKPIDDRIYKQYQLKYVKYTDNLHYCQTWTGTTLRIDIGHIVYMKPDDQIILLLGTPATLKDPIPGYPLYNVTTKTSYNAINMLYNK